MDNTPLILTTEQYDSLRSGSAVTLTVDGVQVTFQIPPRQSIPFKSLEDLSVAVMASHLVTLELVPGVVVDFKVHPLSSELAKQRDDMMAGVMPPKKRGGIERGKVTPDEYDFEDARYIAARDAAVARQQAFVIINGVEGFDVPAMNIDAAAQFLRAKFQPRVLGALTSAVIALTSDPVKIADFS